MQHPCRLWHGDIYWAINRTLVINKTLSYCLKKQKSKWHAAHVILCIDWSFILTGQIFENHFSFANMTRTVQMSTHTRTTGIITDGLNVLKSTSEQGHFNVEFNTSDLQLQSAWQNKRSAIKPLMLRTANVTLIKQKPEHERDNP